MSVSQCINLSVEQPANHEDVDENAGLIDRPLDIEQSKDESSSETINASPRSNRCALFACWLFGMLCAIAMLISIISVDPAFLPSSVQRALDSFDRSISTNQTINYTNNSTINQRQQSAAQLPDATTPEKVSNDALVHCNPLDDRDPRYHPTANAYHNCTSLIDQLMDRHFAPQKAKYPNLLTYRPTVDCSKGRYLLLNDGNFFNDGTGMVMLHRNAVLQFAQSLNLTIVHLPWKSEHLEFESNDEREAFWPVRDWEVSRAQYEQCSDQSNVKKHKLTLQLGIMPFVRPSVSEHSMEPWPLSASLSQTISPFIADRDANIADGGGLTIYSSQTQIAQGSMLHTNIIWEIRWWLKNRLSQGQSLLPLKAPFPSFTPSARQHRVEMARETQTAGVNERLPIELLDYDSEFESCPEIPLEHALKVAVHIRRGDVMAVLEDPPGDLMVRAAHAERYTSNGAFISILSKAYKSLSERAKARWFVTIFSEGYVTDFADIYAALAGLMPNGHCRVSLVLNGRTAETARRIIGSDVIVTSRSAFSTMMALFNSVAVKLDMNHDFQRAHGQANHMQMTVQQLRDMQPKSLRIAHHEANATVSGHLLSDINDKAKMSDPQASIFSQRVDEILALNDMQLQTNEPLFLNFTYGANRPKDWFYV